MVKITIKDLSFSYGSRSILDDLNVVVGDSEVLSLVGPNGSGKTTLIKCIDRILKPKGTILLNGGRNLQSLSRQEVAKYIGYVPQSTTSVLTTTVFDTILMGRKPHMGWRVADEDIDHVVEVMKLLHVEEFALKDFSELSGGQKQRTALAGVLAVPRRVLVLDEPTAMLDPAGREEVLEAVAALRDDGLAIVFVTQEMDEVPGADRVLALERGAVVYAGAAAGLFGDDVLVRRLGLGLPAAGEVALELAGRGRRLDGPLPLTLDDLVGALEGPS